MTLVAWRLVDSLKHGGRSIWHGIDLWRLVNSARADAAVAIWTAAEHEHASRFSPAAAASLAAALDGVREALTAVGLLDDCWQVPSAQRDGMLSALGWYVPAGATLDQRGYILSDAAAEAEVAVGFLGDAAGRGHDVVADGALYELAVAARLEGAWDALDHALALAARRAPWVAEMLGEIRAEAIEAGLGGGAARLDGVLLDHLGHALDELEVGLGTPADEGAAARGALRRLVADAFASEWSLETP